MTRLTNRPAQQPAPTPGEADVVAQVAEYASTGAIIAPAVARVIAAWWHSPAAGAITSMASSGTVTHWLANECEREARMTGKRNQAELAALAAYARFHAGYAYETVIYLDGDSFDEADAYADADTDASGVSWVDAMFEYLSQWEHGDGLESHSTPPWGSGDTEYERDGYVIAVNHRMGYVSLNRVITEPQV